MSETVGSRQQAAGSEKQELNVRAQITLYDNQELSIEYRPGTLPLTALEIQMLEMAVHRFRPRPVFPGQPERGEQ